MTVKAAKVKKENAQASFKFKNAQNLSTV